MLREYHLARSKHYRLSIFIFILLIEDIRDRKVKNINFHSNFFEEIIMNKKKSQHKNVAELTKRLLD